MRKATTKDSTSAIGKSVKDSKLRKKQEKEEKKKAKSAVKASKKEAKEREKELRRRIRLRKKGTHFPPSSGEFLCLMSFVRFW